jgi:hypothetical protein
MPREFKLDFELSPRGRLLPEVGRELAFDELTDP